MSLKPTFRPVLLVFFRLLKCYQNGGSFCCDIQLCNRTRRIVIITRRANDVKMRGKINAGLHNIEDVFVANGYPRETVRRFMEQRPQQIDKREQEEPESRGVVTIPYLKGLSEQFRLQS